MPNTDRDLWREDGHVLRFTGALPGGYSFAVSLRGCGDLGREHPAADFLPFFHRLGLGSPDFYHCRQVHGIDIRTVTEEGPLFLGDGDGLATGTVTAPLGVFTADCLALALVAENGSRALIHSGWRGTRGNIAGETLTALRRSGISPRQVIAVFGPSAHKCCYSVGEEFRTFFPASRLQERDGSLFFDNQGLLFDQLLHAGLDPENIFPNPYCTICRNDIFYSYRREGSAAGRMLNLLYRS